MYMALGITNPLFLTKEKGIVVFCYHSVANDSWRYSVDLAEVQRQIKYLLESHRAISVEELMLHINGKNIIKEPAFLLTFDDGYRDLLTIKPFLTENAVQPVVFVLADTEHAVRAELDNEYPFLSVPELKELQAAGWDIGCHSATHPDFSKLSPQSLVSEIAGAKKELEEKLGSIVKYFAYPKGAHSAEITARVLEAGYQAAFTMDNGYVSANSDLLIVPRIGVDRSHSFMEFKFFTLPAVMLARKLAQRFI